MRPAQRKQAIQYLVAKELRSQRRAGVLVGMSRSVVAYRSRGHGDEVLGVRLEALAIQYPRYGYLMLHGMLKREGLVINAKRTYRVYRERRLQVRTKRRKRLPRQVRLKRVRATEPNQRWSMDFMTDQLADGRRFRILNIVDDYTRQCRGQIVDFSISGSRLGMFPRFSRHGCFTRLVAHSQRAIGSPRPSAGVDGCSTRDSVGVGCGVRPQSGSGYHARDRL